MTRLRTRNSEVDNLVGGLQIARRQIRAKNTSLCVNSEIINLLEDKKTGERERETRDKSKHTHEELR